jgi:ABC-type uncharacterized transport system substrate-binding protein
VIIVAIESQDRIGRAVSRGGSTAITVKMPSATRISETAQVALVRATMAAAITGVSALWTPAARAAKQAKSAIPIVAIVMADPVADDLVASLAEPGGNVNGTTFLGPELVAKRLQLLKEVVPGLSPWRPSRIPCL